MELFELIRGQLSVVSWFLAFGFRSLVLGLWDWAVVLTNSCGLADFSIDCHCRVNLPKPHAVRLSQYPSPAYSVYFEVVLTS